MSSTSELLIDATALGDDSAYRGIGTYVRHLLEGLARQPGLRTTALCLAGAPLPEGVGRVRIRRVAPARWRRREHELLSSRKCSTASTPRPCWRCRGPWVQTLHDVIPLVFEDAELDVERRRWRRHAQRYRHADAIIAVSRYSAEVGTSVLDLDPRRIEVIPHGVGAEFEPPPSGGQAERRDLLLVGEYSKRKGYPEALAVVGALTELGYPPRLRVAGRIAPWVRPAVEAVVGRSPARDRVELLGFVDDLVTEYQQARVLIMSSRYEGFGFPVLEAMACGTPVVAFANSSLTEVVGDAGLLVPDGDVSEMTKAVRSLLDDQRRWSEYSARGLERVKQFSWEQSVARHAEVFVRLAGQGG